jgi:hypothetical protein
VALRVSVVVTVVVVALKLHQKKSYSMSALCTSTALLA